ncbi:MAG TPA: serine hydrolase [Ilumatobacteraceae bacterium]|nr:serine hydrolase [Ilumatobacteraceae bacterium]
MGAGFREQRGQTDSSNWIDSPHNRWGFLHVRELTRTARIAGSGNSLEELPRQLGDIRGFTFDHVDRQWTIGEMLDTTFTDGLMVVHDGTVLFEHYGGLMRPSDTHLLMSVSKSLTATLAGVLVGQGVIDPAGFVPDYINSLRGTSWEGCTVKHLLDMRAGTLFDEEDYSDPDSDGRLIEQVSGYTSLVRTDLPASTYDWIATSVNASDHGGPFQYRSILPDVVAWVMCEATGQTFAELFSQHIWSHVAQHDADIIVDSAGFPVVEGGICTTLEDLARFGVMCLQRGEFDGRQIVPNDWTHRPTTRDQDLIDAFALTRESSRSGPDSCYHDFWWVYDSVAGIYCGLGINGQTLMIHHPSNTVIAKFSTWPDRMDYSLADLTDAGLLAYCASL